VLKPAAWLIAGAVIATAGAAHAQEAVPGAAATSGSVPWYQRFTASNSVTADVTGNPENVRLPDPAWTLNQRWGVTLDVREAQRVDRLPETSRGDQTSVGAYYQFTPRMRLGGEVSVEDTQRPGAREAEEPQAGVRIESAFRF
jgi:hypothetical protein